MGEDRGRTPLNQSTRAAVLELWRDGRRPFTLRLEGGSMDPVALAGDRVTVQPVSAEQLRCGDILALHLGETVVVHRLLMVRTAVDGRRWFCQKGDNSPVWSWILPETVLGRVVTIQGPDRTLHLSRRPWTWINPLTGKLSRYGILLAGGGRKQGDGFRDADPHTPGRRPLGNLAHRLNRGLATPLIRLALRGQGR